MKKNVLIFWLIVIVIASIFFIRSAPDSAMEGMEHADAEMEGEMMHDDEESDFTMSPKDEEHHGHEDDGHHGSHSGEQANYHSHLMTDPVKPAAGVPTKLTFTFADEEDKTITELMTHHARKVHVVLIGEDLDTFGHIHPEDFEDLEMEDGEFAVEFNFPKSGKYLAAVDIMTADGMFSDTHEIMVGSASEMSEVEEDFSRDKAFKGYKDQGEEESDDKYVDPVFLSLSQGQYRVELDAPETVMTGEEITLDYTVYNDGIELDAVEPMLDAPMHLAIVSQDFKNFMHLHADEELRLPITFHEPGLYQIFSQFQHENKIIFSAFMVKVEGESHAMEAMTGKMVEGAHEESVALESGHTEDGDPFLGKEDAPVTVVAYEDYECGFCEKFNAEVLPVLKEKYVATGKVKFVFKDFPLSGKHPNALKAAEAAECADEQGKFWDYHDHLFMNKPHLSAENYLLWAEELGLDVEKFTECLDTDAMNAEVEEDMQDGVDLGVTGTPTVFVNGFKMDGLWYLSSYEEEIEKALA